MDEVTRSSRNDSLSTRINLPPALTALLLFVISAAATAFVMFRVNGFFDDDSYYHVRVALEMISQRRLLLDFPWLPLTILNNAHYTDHHLLYHIFLIPWVGLGGLAGAKLSVAFLMGAIVVATWALLRSLKVRWPAYWTLALFALSSQFLLRMFSVRTQSPSVLLLIAALWLLFTRRYRWMIVLAFAYTWLYDGFVLIVVVVALYTLAVLISERRLDLRPLIFTVIGMALGIVINPYFPRNVTFITDHLIAKINLGSVPVGDEWYPAPLSLWLTTTAGALAALVIGVIGLIARRQFRDRIVLTLLFTALLTLGMMVRAARFVEYYPPFALLFCAYVWGRGSVDLLALLPAPLRSRRLAEVGMIVVLIALAGFYLRKAYVTTVQTSEPLDQWAGASAWLSANTPAGALVYNVYWDEFPSLIYQNTHNTYASGLDPTYLALENPQMESDFIALLRGKLPDPITVIEQEFGARYVLTNSVTEQLLQELESDPNTKIVYQDSTSILLQLGASTSATG